MKADPNNDLVILYDANGQTPKAVATLSALYMSSALAVDGVAGSYSKVVKQYGKNLPKGITVYGDTSSRRFKFIGDVVTDPDSDTFNTEGVSSNWQDLEGKPSPYIKGLLTRLENRIKELENGQTNRLQQQK